MYAVIRAGGKQYRVAPGDVVRMEKLPAEHGNVIEFNDVLAVSAQEGHIGPGRGAVVSGEVVDSGRSDKILVFHFKRKKQYKKIFGHRQPFSSVRITEIAFDGQKFKAPELSAGKSKPKDQEHKEGSVQAAKSGAKKAATKKPKAKAARKSAKKSAGRKKK